MYLNKIAIICLEFTLPLSLVIFYSILKVFVKNGKVGKIILNKQANLIVYN